MNLSNMTTAQYHGILAKDREHFLPALQTLPAIVGALGAGKTESEITTILQDELDTLTAAADARIAADIAAA